LFNAAADANISRLSAACLEWQKPAN
jgi:hypothetical protein